MSLFALDGLPPVLLPLALAAHVVAGAGAGVFFFRSLWWNTRLMIGGGPVSLAIGLLLGRFLLMGSLLTLAAFEGAAPLLASATGVLLGRFCVLRALRNGET